MRRARVLSLLVATGRLFERQANQASRGARENWRNGQRQEGADAGIAVAKMSTGAFPNLELEVKRMHPAGRDVVTEFTVRATHEGELMGSAPTGRKVELPICNVIEVRDGKIYAEREYFDTAHLMQQLGVAAGS